MLVYDSCKPTLESCMKTKTFSMARLYNDERTTFLYDIGKYDGVIIVTDAMYTGKKGINTLINALSTKNKEIYVIRWC